MKLKTVFATGLIFKLKIISLKIISLIHPDAVKSEVVAKSQNIDKKCRNSIRR